ncbi:bifunctional metallophosphatase/5'-nucleotidase [Saccharothrix yanglingensis]|uniref:Bifunctional metallophosphatase/5'-nucleotidase n=1 Tax=Saccharothrix yanglingensis TaxID=659496 RepID=A0ABU0WXP5_9PSEU|nr:5'-nucleotidase C-terminal domain-containing protein [Saccharothrix yanglingensis]MDQ2584283.1 bifunctional metallophosphatase/5'-nucleotidase [Saccharothrix yanglingensis]
MTGSPLHRRALLTGGAGGVLAAAGPGAAHATPGERPGGRRFTLTVLGTTDLHGNVFNWDYFADREFDDGTHDDIGLAKLSTLVKAVREARGAHRTLLVDAGDTIQGTPLAYYYAKVETIGRRKVHPMAAAMNELGYDAAALGNHEFDYGIPLLRAFEKQLDFPLLAANALDAATGRPAFRPYVVKTVWRTGTAPLRVGILGLTNPGIAIWGKAHVEGRMTFPGVLEQAREWVPRLKRAGADLVVVAAHSGADLSSSLGDLLPFPENCSALVAEEVPDIDAILVGHAHTEIAQRFVTNRATGRRVLLTEPLFWGKRLSLMEFDLEWTPRGGWRNTASRSRVLRTGAVPEDAVITRKLRDDHDAVVAYVNSRIGVSKSAMSAATARYEDTAALGFVNRVQGQALKASLAGTPAEALPVLSLASPFNEAAAIPAGDVSVRDVAGLYAFDNTLFGVRLTGAQLKDYLERSVSYFTPLADPGPHAPDAVTNADGTPDYLYDVAAGLDAPLTYDVDLARPVGRRVTGLAHDGTPVAADQVFAVAVSDYRRSGGGNFPHIATAPVLHDRQLEIRQLLIEWVRERGEIDPAEFARVDWRLVVDGVPVEVIA